MSFSNPYHNHQHTNATTNDAKTLSSLVPSNNEIGTSNNIEKDHYQDHRLQDKQEETEEAEAGKDQDTFLSRIFGLNSIYNQLQDNYQYYDPEFDSSYQQKMRREMTIGGSGFNDDDDEQEEQEEQEEQDHLRYKGDDFYLDPDEQLYSNNSIAMSNINPTTHQSSRHQQEKTNNHIHNHNHSINHSINNSNSLLDSESDSDLSSSSDSYVRPAPNKARYSNNKSSRPQAKPSSTQPPPPPPPKEQQRPNIKFQTPPPNLKLDQPLASQPQSQATAIAPPRANPIQKPNGSVLPLYNQPEKYYRKPQQQQQQKPFFSNTNYKTSTTPRATRFVIPPKERALYLWANITNMDEFLSDVYYYYRGKGLLNIALTRIIDLVILVFIIAFTIFLKWGIDYNQFMQINHHDDEPHLTLSDLIIPHFYTTKVPFFVKFLVFGFSIYVILRSIQLYFDCVYKLREVKNFYKHLLNVGDTELMTISWKTIVEKLMLLKDYNSLTSTTRPVENHYINDLSSKIRLNAHDIANRIMRRENYMIALINKNILDLSVLILNEKSVLTRTLEWNLKLCIENFVFNKQGQINGSILKEYNRNQLARELALRFKLAAMINVILCPFIVIYFVLRSFFKYFNEYKSNPSSLIGLRQYTPYAQWKLREFNELPHFFTKRLQMSQAPANTYIDQFPKGFYVINGMKLANFISGSVLAVLVILGIFLENELHSFWSFEITEGRSALFYISIFGTIWAVTSAGSSLDQSLSSSSSSSLLLLQNKQSTYVYDPEANIRYVSQFTHYLPSSWNKKLHTIQVKNEFCELYSLKIFIIINELLSLILTPFILWFNVSRNSGAIVDFFREYSIHVDGLGYVCYFAMFNFEEKNKNMMYAEKNQQRTRSRSKHTRGKSKISKSDLEEDKALDDDHFSNMNIDIKPARKRFQSVSESDEDSSNDYDALLYFQNDDKMIKSYMYFLESYGGTKQAQPNQHQTGKQHNLIKPRSAGNARSIGHTQLSKVNQREDNESLGESIYKVSHFGADADAEEEDEYDDDVFVAGDYKNGGVRRDVDDDDNYYVEDNGDSLSKTARDKSKRKGGVIGMLNQFYKQDIGQNARV